MKNLILLLAFIMAVTGCSSQSTGDSSTEIITETGGEVVVTPTQEPTPTPKPIGESLDDYKVTKKLKFWSTYYYAPVYKSVANGYPLRDKNGKDMGVDLSHKDICNLMMQGSGEVDGKIYGWGAVTSYKKTDCTKFYSRHPGIGKLKFKINTTHHGVKGYSLVTYKSIAVDKGYIPYGSKLYIPKLKGIIYKDGNVTKTHDGFVYAHDTGGAIKGNHIDFYIGPSVGGFSNTSKIAKPVTSVFVKSSAKRGLFDIYIVKKK